MKDGEVWELFRDVDTPPGGLDLLDVTDATGVQVGWVYDVTAPGLVRARTEDEVTATLAPLTKTQFVQRFTADEMTAIVAFESSALSTSEKNKLRYWLLMLHIADFIYLSRQESIDGINHLVTLGYLTSDRAAAILSGAPLS